MYPSDHFDAHVLTELSCRLRPVDVAASASLSIAVAAAGAITRHFFNTNSNTVMFMVLPCCCLQGEGRAIALSKSVLLGEALPPMRLVFQDSHGNTVPVGAGGGSSEAQQQPAVTLQVLEAGPGGGGAVLQELQAAADMVRRRLELFTVVRYAADISLLTCTRQRRSSSFLMTGCILAVCCDAYCVFL